MRTTNHAPSDPGGVREDIAASWRRVSLLGLDPAVSLDQLVPVEVDPTGSLLVGASPVLAELEESLRGTTYATVLVDRDCRIVRRWYDDAAVGANLEVLNIRDGVEPAGGVGGHQRPGHGPGDRSGPRRARDRALRRGAPGVQLLRPPDPAPADPTDRGRARHLRAGPDSSPLLPALISRAVRDIEQRLLDGSRSSEKSLLAAFQAAAGLRRRAILAIGEDIVLSNQAATDLLSAADLALLRVLSEEPFPGSAQSLALSLESGRAVSVELTKVSGARRGVLVRVDPVSGDLARSVASRARSDRVVGPPTLVTGVPGSGRTTRARELATALPVHFLRPAAALLEGAPAWARQFEETIARRTGTVCIDGIDLLPDALLDLVVDSVDLPRRPQLVLTSGPVDTLTGRAATLAGMATVREELVPLASRRQDIPELAAGILRGRTDTTAHLSPPVVAALAAQPWPGNLRELSSVLAHAATRRSSGALVLDDLPEQYRSVGPSGPRSELDRAEREVIVAALRRAEGNKVRAAQALGLSRTTLYARLRTLRITTY